MKEHTIKLSWMKKVGKLIGKHAVALATLFLAIFAAWSIYQGYDLDGRIVGRSNEREMREKEREAELNRAYLYAEVFFKDYINQVEIRLINTGKTQAKDVSYDIYIKSEDEEIDFGSYPVGDINPNQIHKRNRQLEFEKYEALYKNLDNTLNIDVSYSSIYGDCFRFIYPIGSFHIVNDELRYSEQSVEEYEC